MRTPCNGSADINLWQIQSSRTDDDVITASPCTSTDFPDFLFLDDHVISCAHFPLFFLDLAYDLMVCSVETPPLRALKAEVEKFDF
jgi:hypothetical protein